LLFDEREQCCEILVKTFFYPFEEKIENLRKKDKLNGKYDNCTKIKQYFSKLDLPLSSSVFLLLELYSNVSYYFDSYYDLLHKIISNQSLNLYDSLLFSKLVYNFFEEKKIVNCLSEEQKQLFVYANPESKVSLIGISPFFIEIGPELLSSSSLTLLTHKSYNSEYIKYITSSFCFDSPTTSLNILNILRALQLNYRPFFYYLIFFL
jgi:hypothetical protein